MGIYQSYVGCTLLVALVYLQYMLIKNESVKRIATYIRNGLVTGCLGFILYELMLKLMVKLYNITLSNYKNFNQISLKGIISNFIPDFINEYRYYYKYFMGTLYHSNKFEGRIFLICIAMIFICLIKYSFIPLYKTNKVRALISAALLWLLPAACNISCILAPLTDISIQQTASLALVIPVLFALALSTIPKEPDKKSIIKSATVVAAVLILWGNIFVTQADEEAMRSGTNATKSIAASILDTLIDKKLYPSEEYTYMFYGSPAKNDMFYKNYTFRNANYHAKFGEFTFNNVGNQRGWIGIYRYLLGVDMPACKEALVEPTVEADEFKAMPVYPAEGSIAVIDNVVVVKVAEQ